jgi:Flp pilus assembly protein TadG
MRRARRAQNGQAIIEFALFFTFMMFLLAGVTDIAGLLDGHMNVVYAARQGARTGAVLNNQQWADCAIVGAIHAVLANQPNITLTQITIYQADSTGQDDGTHEIYPGNSNCLAPATAPSPGPIVDGWPSTTRTNTTFPSEDSIGVQLNYSYQWQFGLVGSGTFSTSDFAVFPLNVAGEPTPLPTGAG